MLERTPLRKSNEGYLELYYHRKNELVDFVKSDVLADEIGCSLFNPVAGPPVLTPTQISEISTYIEHQSSAFIGSIQTFQNRKDCSREYQQVCVDM